MSEIQALFDRLEAFELQPIEQWHPEKVIDIDIRIDARGIWHYRGSPIQRHRISKLFSTVLRLEGEIFYLVTPPVKYRIRVDEAPFVAVDVNRRGRGENQNLYFRTNMDEVVLADRDHPVFVRIDDTTREPSPYIEVRNGLVAKMTRSVFYQIADMMVAETADGNTVYRLHSAGTCFSIGAPH